MSYHSSALPIDAAAITRIVPDELGAGVACVMAVDDIGFLRASSAELFNL
jgi:hypothetical protein